MEGVGGGEGDNMPLLHWKTMWGYMFPQYLQGSAD